MSRPVPNATPSVDPGTLRLALIGEFDETDYLFGFLACDGCFSKNGTTIDLQLQERDRVVIELFCKAYNTKIEKPRLLAGRFYLRARAHGRLRWAQHVALLGGPEKRARRWPANATTAFAAGCLDADGCFYVHHGAVEGEFQHASSLFREGFQQWLQQRELQFSARKDRPIIAFGPATSRELGKLWPACGLTRKQDVTRIPIKRDHREWLDWQIAIAQDRSLSQSEVARRTGKTAQAVNIKRWRLFNATSA